MENKAINAIRMLGVDAVNQANSGHPGIVLGAAPMIYELFSKYLQIDVKQPKWINRDRFILSAGHGSALLYAINHLIGYKITIDDLKNFRQMGNTPGHPEYGHTEGVETTSGPLGQGISNAVGMAIAESHLAARFNKIDCEIINHYTYVVCGDGDLQEGVALESLSLAGHLGLNKLIVLYDSNDIQLDGKLSLAYSENNEMKFNAIGWNYIRVEDGNNLKLISQAISTAQLSENKPTMIEIKTIIGYGTQHAGTSKVHGSPIGQDEATQLRKRLNWESEPFVISRDIYDHFKKHVTNRGKNAHNQWKKLLKAYQLRYPTDFELLNTFYSDNQHVDIEQLYDALGNKDEATRSSSGKAIEYLSNIYPNLIGGSADLTSSTKAKGADGHFSRDNRLGRNINFGVREHAMAAIVNGITLHGGLKVFGGGFFVFSDYMKPAIRLSAIMNIPSIFVFTHDSIAVGEDGPTHQPIEQLVGLRAIPNLNVIRPADSKEVAGAWKIAIESKNTPTIIVLTRQNVKAQIYTSYEGMLKGAYVVVKEQNKLDGILLASGSEVELAIDAQQELLKQNVDVRVVSMPSHFLYEKQTNKYKKQLLPKRIKTMAIEMGSPISWYKYTSFVYGIDTFGISAPQDVVLKHFGFTKENIVKEFLSKK